MLEFQHVTLPDYYTHLLKVNMQSSAKSAFDLKAFLHQHKESSVLLKMIFADLDNTGSTDRLLKAVGWLGIRDRMANAFCHKLITGGFHSKQDYSLITDILEFEDQLKKYTVEGHSRAFLLGFYLKNLLLQLRVTKTDESIVSLVNSDEIFQLLQFSRARIIKIDWLIILILHFKFFFGFQPLLQDLKAGKDWNYFYQKCTPGQLGTLITNMLCYGSSINENDIFINDLT